MNAINLYTIGFTKKTAEKFFTSLKNAGVKRVLDVRLSSSQLDGFAKKNHLGYLLDQLGGIEYRHIFDGSEPESTNLLAPEEEMWNAYKKQKGDWETYEKKFLKLMAKRKIENLIDKEILDGACLLCSEHEPHHCHRRLVAEYLQDKWGEDAVRVTHLPFADESGKGDTPRA